MRTVTLHIYKFEELSPNARKRAKDDYYDELGYADNQNMFAADVDEILRMLGFSDAKFAYSLTYCQGDGVSFTFSLEASELVAFIKLIRGRKSPEKGYKLMQTLIDNIDRVTSAIDVDFDMIEEYDIRVDSKRVNHMYSHVNTCRIDGDAYDYPEPTVVDHVKAATTFVERAYYQICSALEAHGYVVTYAHMDDDEFSELSSINEWEYLVDGSFYHGGQ